MPGEDNAALVARFLDELWNKKNLSIIDELTDENYVLHIPKGKLLGREALKVVAKYYFGSFTAIHISTELQISVVSQDPHAVTRKVVTRLSWDTTLNLKDQSSGQEISREIKAIAGVSIDRIDDRGQIAESWNMLDTLYWLFNIQEVTRIPAFVQTLPGVTPCDPNQPRPCSLGQICVQEHCVAE